MSHMCAAPMCDREAVTAVHRLGRMLIVRNDHLTPGHEADWRCVQCACNATEDQIVNPPKHAEPSLRYGADEGTEGW